MHFSGFRGSFGTLRYHHDPLARFSGEGRERRGEEDGGGINR